MTSKYLLLTSMVDTYVMRNAMNFGEPDNAEENVKADFVKGRSTLPNPTPAPSLALALALVLALALALALALTLALALPLTRSSTRSSPRPRRRSCSTHPRRIRPRATPKAVKPDINRF